MLQYYALDRNCIAAATYSDNGGKRWVCFVGIVEGRDHFCEARGVCETGNRVKREIAIAMFPDLDAEKFDDEGFAVFASK
jgi:hypothetical protein